MTMMSLLGEASAANGAAVYQYIISSADSTRLETTIVAVILTCFLLIRQKTPSKVDTLVRKSRLSKNLFNKDGEAEQVHTFVAAILAKGCRAHPGVLKKYESLVWEQGIALNKHITDVQQARSFYASLIAASLKTCKPSSTYIPGGKLRPNSWTSRLLGDMRLFGFPRTVQFYGLVMKLHGQEGLYQDALALYEEMNVDQIEPDSGMCIWLLTAAVAYHDHKRACHFFERLCQLGEPSLRTFMTMLRGHAQQQDWQGAVKMLENMTASGIAADNLVLNHVLGLCVSMGQTSVAEDLLQKYADLADTITYNTLLKGYAHQADFLKAEAFLKRMLASGPAPNAITFNTVMDCAVRAILRWDTAVKASRGKDSTTRDMPTPPPLSIRTLVKQPWEILDSMIKHGVEPDRYTVSTIVKGMHMTGGSTMEIDRAVALVRRLGPERLEAPAMQNKSTHRDGNKGLVEVLFNTLLDICCASRALDRLIEIFGIMQEYNVPTSTITFGTLIKALGQAGRLEQCHQVWEQIRSLKLKPSVVTYGCYIDACIRNQDMSSAQQMFDDMLKNGIHPNAVVFTSLIRGYANSGQPLKALELYQKMRQDGVQPQSATFNSILDVVVRQLEDKAVAQKVVRDMGEANVMPDSVTYSILIKASCNSGNVENALAFFHRNRKCGKAFDQVTFNSLLLACCKSDRVADAEEIFQDMMRLKMTPTSVTTSILVKMYGRAKLPEYETLASLHDALRRNEQWSLLAEFEELTKMKACP